MGFDVLNVPLVQGIYPIFAEGNLDIFAIPRSQVQGGGANSRCIIHECLHVLMYMIYIYLYFRWQFESFPAYVMSQRWLRTRTFVTMPVEDAPRIKKN